MDFGTALAASGLLADRITPDGRWYRCPTTDKPRTHKNGAYLLSIDGRRGWWKNYATELSFNEWRDDSRQIYVDPARAAADQARIVRLLAQRRQEDQTKHERAARRAEWLIQQATPGPANYLHRKGFPKANGLVLKDGSLVCPMRNWKTNALMGAQVIRWNTEARVWEKKFNRGMQSKGAVYRLGRPTAHETYIAEGMASAMSIEAATAHMHLNASIIVAFSAGNLIHVAKAIKADRPGARIIGIADNDESGAGEKACQAAEIPYSMSATAGQDANDVHVREGLMALCGLVNRARRG